MIKESEFFIPDHSVLLTKVRKVKDIEPMYGVTPLHIHNNPVCDISTRHCDPSDLERDISPNIILKVEGEWEKVARLEKDCMTLIL